MRGHGGTVRGTGRFTGAAFGALALCAAFALTGCNGDDGADATGPAPATSAPSAAPPAASPAAGSPTAPTGAPTTKSPTKPAPSATASAPGKPKPPAPVPAPPCDHKPISPNEVAVNRWTPEGGFSSLIVKHGAWGCPGADGKTSFVTVGEETFIPIAEDAKISAMAPILAGSVSKPITLHELTSWLEAHPNQGLVFHYHVGPTGEIDTLGQEEYLS